MFDIVTPCFVINKDDLLVSINSLKDAANKYFVGGYIVGYSYKTNSLPYVIRFMKKNGFYAEVVSDDEYNLAKAIKVNKSSIVYNGIAKSKITFLEALRNGAIVNIDSQKEIGWLNDLDKSKQYNIGLRVNFDLEKYCPNESQCGDEGGRFGFCYENGEFEKALESVKKLDLKVNSIHLHCSSKTRSLNIYKAISKIACEIKNKYNLELDYVDVGGGFFGGLPNKPQFEDYFKLISEELSKGFDLSKIKVIIEPGMALIGANIDFVAEVTDVKDTTYNHFVVINGSRTNIDPLMTKSSYYYELLARSENKHPKQIISGFTCMEHDRLLTLVDEPELKVGDEIIFHKVGAYTMCLSPMFIKYLPRVYVKDENEYVLVRNSTSAKDYLKINSK